MAFNASNVNTRYSAAGNIAVLKEDFTKICGDMISMQTFMKTASADAGKFTTLFADSLTSAGAISGTTGTFTGALSGATLTVAGAAWPAGILLNAINTGGYASANTNGAWKQLRLDDTVVPGTNISLRHLKQVASSFTASNVFSFVNGYNSETGNSGVQTNRIRIITPTTVTSDGGNNFQFYILAQTTAVSSVPNTSLGLGCFVSMGSFINSGSGTFHSPHFVYFGFNTTGVDIQFTTGIKGFNLADA
jgi:hypothetical protein